MLALLFSFFFVGCSDNIILPSAEELAQFENAGPQQSGIDMDRLVSAKIGGGPHRVVYGEVLELTMPSILQVVTAEEPEITEKTAPYVCRVSQAGTITLPVVGEVKVEGKTLAKIELEITDAYHPRFTVTRPSVFVRILEYKTAVISVTGAVNKPGIYSLRSDQTSLVALLMEAEGIVDNGAAFIRITHPDQDVPDNESATFVLPVKGYNIPFADVDLQDGDRVVVERFKEPLLTVIGLVNKPGNFIYPPDVQYNLMQALAFAGGLNLAAEPRYATVYRLKPDGTIVSVIFQVAQEVANTGYCSLLTEAVSIHIKPGDIIIVEHTPRTRSKMFLDRVFRINIGTYLRLDDSWD
jgi:polysaccharide export outer membrane protein